MGKSLITGAEETFTLIEIKVVMGRTRANERRSMQPSPAVVDIRIIHHDAPLVDDCTERNLVSEALAIVLCCSVYDAAVNLDGSCRHLIRLHYLIFKMLGWHRLVYARESQ